MSVCMNIPSLPTVHNRSFECQRISVHAPSNLSNSRKGRLGLFKSHKCILESFSTYEVTSCVLCQSPDSCDSEDQQGGRQRAFMTGWGALNFLKGLCLRSVV